MRHRLCCVHFSDKNLNGCPLPFHVNMWLADTIKYDIGPTGTEPIEPSHQRCDAEFEYMWQRFTTSAGQLSEAITVHF